VTFLLVTFYFKLQFRALHAYIIPTGLGVLVLQELFRARIQPEARNWIRLVTLLAMIGSAGYYALADTRYEITFNLTMILLCLAAMGLGSFLRIRLYLGIGFAGLLVDLGSILYKVLVKMERSSRMTIIGVLVLVIGAVLVFGAIYYKTNKAKFDAWVDGWRRKLSQWQ
jgi:CDP-diglyceride synthetase